MQYTVNRGEKGKVEVKVDIPKADFSKSYGEVLEGLSRETKVEGFRSGKVPRDVLENKIGANKILNETASFLISKTLGEIFIKEDIAPLGNPSIAIHTLSKDSAFSFTASFVTKPKVKIGNWKTIKLKKVEAKKVTDEDVVESIGNIYEAWRKSRKSKSEVEGESEADDQQTSNRFIYDAHGNKIFIKDEESKSKSKVESGTKLDDEFAKAIGARDLAHLKKIVRRDLEQIFADRVEAKLEEELFDEILKISDVDVPDILVDDEVNRMMVRLNQNLEQQTKKLDDFLREQNTTVEALRAKWREQAEKNVRVTLVMDEIGKSEKVEVSKEEVENASKGVDESKLTEPQKADLRNYLGVSIFQAKTLDLVKKVVAS